MTKRLRMDRLTGGTRDVNPQLLGANVVMSAANTFTETEVSVPVLRVTMQANRAQVIEILGVWFNYSGEDLDSASERYQAQIVTSTATAIVRFDNSDHVVPALDVQNNLLTSGASVTENVFYRDMTDGAGHGVIVATPSVFFGMNSTGLAAAAACNMLLKYRFKNVSLQEFIGLAIQQST